MREHIRSFIQRENNMGLFDGVMGGIMGAGLTPIISGIIEKNGGVQGLISQFEQQGMGSTIQSWIGSGPNQEITPEEIHKVLGSDTVKEWASKFGVSPDMVADKLAALLPGAVNEMTPEGKVAA
jgi:uncharacterized protein YidB (DUF937 family)